MNKYLSVLGVSEDWKCTDVVGFDKELLAIVPKPVAALLLLFPLNEKVNLH